MALPVSAPASPSSDDSSPPAPVPAEPVRPGVDEAPTPPASTADAVFIASVSSDAKSAPVVGSNRTVAAVPGEPAAPHLLFDLLDLRLDRGDTREGHPGLIGGSRREVSGFTSCSLGFSADSCRLGFGLAATVPREAAVERGEDRVVVAGEPLVHALLEQHAHDRVERLVLLGEVRAGAAVRDRLEACPSGRV